MLIYWWFAYFELALWANTSICFIFLEFGWNGTLDTENSDAPLCLLLNQANWSTVKIKSKLFNDAQWNFKIAKKIAFLDVVQHHNHKNQRPWTGTGLHRGEHGGQHHEGGRHHHEGSRRNLFWAKVFQVKTFASKTIFRRVHLLSFASLFFAEYMVVVDSAPIYNFLLFCCYQNFFLTSSPFLCIAQ